MLVDRFVEGVRTKNADRSSQAAALADTVLKPVAGWQTAERLYVVPDGRLHLLPFQMLVTETAVKPPIVSSVPSANVFALLRSARPTATPERAFMGIGGVPYDRMCASAKTGTGTSRSDETRGLFDAPYPTELPVLPTAQREVLAAASLLGSTSVVLTGDQATESAVKAQRLDGFEVLHFAVHAFADPKFPERAALVLLNDPATGDDGLLQPREIGQLRVNAGVVVLSACDTAVGPTLGQEGVLNLARAFLIAGAKSVITTLWAVSDATSTAVMRRFYENIAAGMDVAEALARSKAAVLEQLGTDALSTVAAFQVVGLGDHRLTLDGSSRKRVSTSVAPQKMG
ncbi:MAG: CHAT domain-containing protein [Vicinamibacteraceae bacterium]